MPRVLIADDEPAIVMAIRDELAFEGWDVDAAATGPDAVAMTRTVRPDVLVLDLMLPGQNGFEVCRALRPERPDLWIIMLTVRSQEADRVTGFEAGADDYVTKPFSLRELVGRIRVGLRRGAPRSAAKAVRVGDLVIDLAARQVLKAGGPVILTPKEFALLALLVARAGEAISRDQFLDAIWGTDVHVTHRTVDTHLSALRRKIEPDPDAPTYIIGVRGIGYRFERGFTRS